GLCGEVGLPYSAAEFRKQTTNYTEASAAQKHRTHRKFTTFSIVGARIVLGEAINETTTAIDETQATCQKGSGGSATPITAGTHEHPRVGDWDCAEWRRLAGNR